MASSSSVDYRSCDNGSCDLKDLWDQQTHLSVITLCLYSKFRCLFLYPEFYGFGKKYIARQIAVLSFICLHFRGGEFFSLLSHVPVSTNRLIMGSKRENDYSSQNLRDKIEQNLFNQSNWSRSSSNYEVNAKDYT